MSPELLGLIGIILMFVFMFMGMPIGICLAVTGFFGQVSIFGWNGALTNLGLLPYATIASFTLCIVPLFMLMGELSHASGITEDSYSFVYKIIGRVRGGLAMSTIGASAIFAACTGSTVASAATFTKVALPEMRKREYDPGLATASIAAGGTLGMLIPPSNPMILYSIFTGASIGKLFIAGVIPGIILTFFFIITIYLITTISPKKGPVGEKSNIKDILSEAKKIWPAVVLIIGVMGGIWGGFFSPSEAGAFGSFVSLLILIWKKKGSSIGEIGPALTSTAQSSGMIFTIIIGALIFGDFMTVSALPGILVKFISESNLSTFMVIFILMIIYVILGALMEEIAVMLITIPIIMPALEQLGVDTVWFGILFMINQQMGLILPPVGFIVFVLAGMIPDIPMYTIYKGILPFAAAMFVCIVLIMFFPGIAVWLPGLIMK
jgi:tripartite ATP-independent transporter DctM subunit